MASPHQPFQSLKITRVCLREQHLQVTLLQGQLEAGRRCEHVMTVMRTFMH